MFRLCWTVLYVVLVQIHSTVYISVKPVKHHMLVFFCSLGSATYNQSTTMLVDVKAVGKAMLLLRIIIKLVLLWVCLSGIISI